MTRALLYAPMNPPSPGSPPSGDRAMSGLLGRALARLGYAPEAASALRAYEGAGDAAQQKSIAESALGEAERLIALHRNAPPALWLTYLNYYKSPDYLGPTVTAALKIPYVIVEASYAAKRAAGDFAAPHAAAKRALQAAHAVVAMTAHDAAGLAEIVFACDRSFMLQGTFKGDNRAPAAITLSAESFGPYPMSNGITRLETRFLGEPGAVARAREKLGTTLDADACEELGLVTAALDHIDWDDEVRIFLEERASFSADGLTGLEANLRFAGPETMETKIFGRLTAWQNWIFQRPNAAGPDGALKRYGSGVKASFRQERT